MKLTALTVENVDLLHALSAAPPGATARSVAEGLGRDESNFAKTVRRLEGEGVVARDGGLALTATGAAIARFLAPDGEVLAATDTVMLRHDELTPDPDNDRTEIDPGELDALRESILTKGLLQNLVVSPPAEPGGKYLIVAGERRWRAVGDAIANDDWGPRWGPARDRLPCKVVAGLSALDRDLARLTENLQREDLHPLDEGAAFKRLVAHHGLSTADVAEAIGKSRKHVQDRIALTDKLADADKARMRLPKDDPERLDYRAARDLIQQHREKPPVDVTPKEALVLLELAHRIRARPSYHPMFLAAGWTQAPKLPAGGAAASLVEKGLIEVREAPADAGAFARLTRGPRRADLTAWIAERGDGALWSARVEVLGALVASDLERLPRYATDWLNAPLPSPEVPTAPALPAPPPLDPLPADAGDDEAAEVPGFMPGAEAASSFSPPASVEEAPIQPTLGGLELPPLTPAQAAMMTEIAFKIARDGEAGPQGAYQGARAWEFHRDAVAQQLVFARLIKFQPNARRDGMLVCLTTLGQTWFEISVSDDTSIGPYKTAWLSPPPAAQTGGNVTVTATGSVDSGLAVTTHATTGPLARMIGDDFSQQIRAAATEETLTLSAQDVRIVRELFTTFVETEDEESLLAGNAGVDPAAIHDLMRRLELDAGPTPAPTPDPATGPSRS